MAVQEAAPQRTRKIQIPQPQVQIAREQAVKPVRERATGRIEVEGRDGKIVSRKRTANGDIFAIPPHLIPDGWDYQWNPHTVLNEPQIEAQMAMSDNGWTPVPAERHPGVFKPVGQKGAIVRGGLILEERPMALTLEARREEEIKAKMQLRDARESVNLQSKLPAGYSDDPSYRGAGGSVTNNIVRVDDAPRPQMEIAND